MIAARFVLLLSCALFSLGVYGMLTRRNAIGLLLAVELILNASAINFVLFSRAFSHIHGQAFALFVIEIGSLD